MSIKYHKKFKDKKNRQNFIKMEKKKQYLKFISFRYNKLLINSDLIEKKKALLYLNKIQTELQNQPKVKINNYCILTGRSKGVYRDFKLSRHQVKQNFKFLCGLRNSSF